MISPLNYCAVWLALFAFSANAYYVTLDAHAEECFFDKVSAGTKLGIFLQLSSLPFKMILII